MVFPFGRFNNPNQLGRIVNETWGKSGQKGLLGRK
jgi:hypothetical protein